jgi:hypothetical protein
MRTTQQFNITRPLEMAEAVERTVKSGARLVPAQEKILPVKLLLSLGAVRLAR